MLDTVQTSSFGALLRRHRLAAGLTQEELAERAGVSVRRLGDLERGAPHRPRPDTVALLVRALGLSPQDEAMFTEASRRLALAGRATPGGTASGNANPTTLPFVGRTAELALLERHLLGGGPPVLLLAGEPGIGKSRLLHEAAHRALDLGWTVLEGGCQRRGEQEPYAPLLDALKRHIESCAPVQMRAELRGCAWLVRLLPELAGGPIESLPAWTLSAAQEQRLMAEAAEHFLSNVAGPAGTLLVLDDLQWAGSDALNLLTTIFRSSFAIPLRMIGAYRSTEIHEPLSGLLADLAHAGLVVHHSLPPLTVEEAEQLLHSLLAENIVQDPALHERVLQRVGGVPFFLVSYAQGLRQGTIEGVPWSLSQSIQQRIAVLPDPAREMLRAAAIVGRRVTRVLLASVVPGPEDKLLSALEAACRAGLLVEAGDTAYHFTHDIVREVVEASLSAARRALLHQRVAEALERSPGDGGALPVELLAYHYAHSDVHGKAVLYLDQAGDRARAQYGHGAAESYYRAVIERLDESGKSVDAARVREKLGVVLRTVARYKDALMVLERAAETYNAMGELESLGRVTAQIAWVHADKGTASDGVARVQPVLALLEAQGTSRSLAALYAALSNLYYFSGMYPSQLVAAERAEHLARVVGDDSIRADALYSRGFGYYSVGRMTEALETLEMAILVAEAEGSYYCMCYGLALVGDIYDERGEFDVSRRNTERAIEIAERHGDRAMAALLTTGHGMSAFYTGDWTAAHHDYERAVSMSRAVGESWSSVYPLLDLGRLCLAEGAWDEASRYLEECECLVLSSMDRNARGEVESVLAERNLLAGRPEIARERLTPLLGTKGLQDKSAAYLQPRLAWALLDLGDVEQAEQLAERALVLMRANGQRLYMVDALRVQAMIFIRQERWVNATRALEEGLALARSTRYPYAEARLLRVYGQRHMAKGEPGPARERLEAALAICQRLGARKDAEWVEQDLAGLKL